MDDDGLDQADDDGLDQVDDDGLESLLRAAEEALRGDWKYSPSLAQAARAIRSAMAGERPEGADDDDRARS